MQIIKKYNLKKIIFVIVNVILTFIIIVILTKNNKKSNNYIDGGKFTFSNFIESTFDISTYQEGSIGVLYIFRNIKDNEARVNELIDGYAKVNAKGKKVYPFIYYDEKITPERDYSAYSNIKKGQFKDVAENLNVKKGLSLIFNIKNKAIMKIYELYLNPYTTMEMLNGE